MSSVEAGVASFVENAPPGELDKVIENLKSLTVGQVNLDRTLKPAFKKHNEDQYITVKLPGKSDEIILSSYNALAANRFYDTLSQSVFDVDHETRKTSNIESYPTESTHADLIQSLHRAYTTAASEHFPSSTISIYPASDSTLAILLVANKYNPANLWNARWRSTYLLDPNSNTLSGTIRIEVHYYERGNVRMTSSRKVEASVSATGGAAATAVVKEIAKLENKYQEELNASFSTLENSTFKSLRRTLPVTRQKVEWEKIGGYRLGQDIGGGRGR